MIHNIQVLFTHNDKKWASVRDYIIKEHIRGKKTLRIVYKDRYMDLTPKQLKKYTKIDPVAHQSKFYPDQHYYEWKQHKSVNEKQDLSNPFSIQYKYK